MKKEFYILLMMFVCIFSLPVLAKDWTAEEIPMVHLQDARKYVCDPEGLMSEALRDSTDSYLHRLEKESGVQSVFVIVSNVENADVFRVAQDIGNTVGVGQKDDRGLVVVVAVDDRKYFIAPGEGLEGDLTDVTCGSIGRECIVKNMRLGNTDMAMLSTAKAIYSKLSTGETGLESTESDSEDSPFLAILLIVIIFFWIYLVSKNKNNGGKGNSGNRGSGGGGWFGPIIWGNPGHLNDRNFGGGFSGGSFGGGSFGGGGAGGGW